MLYVLLLDQHYVDGQSVTYWLWILGWTCRVDVWTAIHWYQHTILAQVKYIKTVFIKLKIPLWRIT